MYLPLKLTYQRPLSNTSIQCTNNIYGKIISSFHLLEFIVPSLGEMKVVQICNVGKPKKYKS